MHIALASNFEISNTSFHPQNVIKIYNELGSKYIQVWFTNDELSLSTV